VNDNLGFQVDLKKVVSESPVPNDSGSLDKMVVSNTAISFNAIYRFVDAKPLASIQPALSVEEPVVAKKEVLELKKEVVESVVPAPTALDEMCRPSVSIVEINEEALFEFNQSKITLDKIRILDEVAEKIKGQKDAELVLVIGHADRIGTISYNQKLSDRRAESVKNYLKSRGLDNIDIKTYGKGETEPVALCADIKNKEALVKCLAPNRRVIINMKGKENKTCH